MCGNTLSKYINEDLYVHGEEYQEIGHAFFHCAHCEYKTNYRCELDGHIFPETVLFWYNHQTQIPYFLHSSLSKDPQLYIEKKYVSKNHMGILC